MAERAPESLQQKIEERLRYYEDLGIRFFYRDRTPAAATSFVPPVSTPVPSSALQENSLPKPLVKPLPLKPAAMAPASRIAPIVAPSGPTLFESVDKIKDDTLPKIREDIGDCTRCKLHKGRNKIVFGDGSPKAELVFIGEGPGADEDQQGHPVCRPRRQIADADDRSDGPAAQRRLHLQCREMPAAGKSRARAG